MTPLKHIDVSTSRTENEILFSFPESKTSTFVIIKVDEADSTVYLDNFEFYEADATVEDPDDYIRFEYNATKLPVTIPLTKYYVDARGNYYSGNVTLQPYTSLVLIEQEGLNTLNSIKNSSNLLVYPNPTSGRLTVEVNEPIAGISTLKVFNMAGQVVHMKELSEGFQKTTFGIENIPSGMYILNVEGETFSQSKKLIVR